MKKVIGIVVIIVSSLFWIQCSPPDDDLYWGSVRLEIEDVLQVENKENYIVGDTLFFELNFSRFLPEEGHSNLLDVYETSGAKEFSYSFGISKYSQFSEAYQWFNVSEKFVISEKGTVYYSDQVATVLNEETDVYESRIGIILAEEGEYQLDFDYLNLYGEYVSDMPSVVINHIVTETNPTVFNFVVTN